MNKVDIEQTTRADLAAWQAELREQFEIRTKAGLNLDLTRGKPAPAQLDLSNDLTLDLHGDLSGSDGTDVRNYGGLTGLPEARRLGGEILDLDPDLVMVGGNSSLTFMYQYLAFALSIGVAGEDTAWANELKGEERIKFLCPVPGYDRHFAICEHLGIEMLNIPFTAGGPDIDQIEELLSSDPLIKGIWCVPKYSNPTGHCYSDQIVDAIAGLALKAGPNFRIMWDNAYAVHFLGDGPAPLKSIYAACSELGTQDSVILTGSTSKITFAGAGISFLGTSPTNLKHFQDHLAIMTIGPDKLNQLRHSRFFSGNRSLIGHMAGHRDIIKPKFEQVLSILASELEGTGMGSWTCPEGGYFISFNSAPGLATVIIDLASQAGVKLTPAGSTFPYRRDPDNCNIRLAPTFPSLKDLTTAMEVFVLCVKLASVEARLARLDADK